MIIERADESFCRGMQYFTAAGRLQAMAADYGDTTGAILQDLAREFRRRAYAIMEGFEGAEPWVSTPSPLCAIRGGR